MVKKGFITSLLSWMTILNLVLTPFVIADTSTTLTEITKTNGINQIGNFGKIIPIEKTEIKAKKERINLYDPPEGQEVDGDNSSTDCQVVANRTWTTAGCEIAEQNNNYFLCDTNNANRYDGYCCGDDPNESYINDTSIRGSNAAACCINSTGCVNSSGQCVPIGTGDSDYKCIDGNWVEVGIKCDWNDQNCGTYCNSSSQCWISGDAFDDISNVAPTFFPNVSDFSQGLCINDEEYLLDHYCENGTWTTRTKLIALQFLEFTNRTTNDYRLYCDRVDNVVNSPYYTTYNIPVISFFNSECILNDVQLNCMNENICALWYNETGQEKVALGFNFNVDIDDSQVLQYVFNKNNGYCGINTNQFTRCSSDDKFWYNGKIKSLIYAKNGILSLTAPTWWDWFLSFLKNPLTTILELIQGSFNEFNSFTLLNKSTDFNKIPF